jgi:beta-lactamase class A
VLREPPGRHRFTHPIVRIELPPPPDAGRFRGALEALARREIAAGGAERIAVYYQDLESGTTVGVDEEARFAGASLLKVPVLLWWMRRAEEQPEVLTETIVNDLPGDLNGIQGARPRAPLQRGRAYSIHELLYRLIADSDNNSVALLGQPAGADLDAVCADLGIRVDRGEPGMVSAREAGSMFAALYNATFLGRHMSEAALALLAQTHYRKGLVAGVPPEVDVAHKYGERTRETPDGAPVRRDLHDCGIVYRAGAPYVLCVMTAGRDFAQLSTVIAEVSRLVYTEAAPAR